MVHRLGTAILLAAALAGCTNYVQPSPAFHEVLTQPYQFDAGDKLRIVVYGQEGLTNTYAVGASGAITMPLIGPVPARGLTPAQLAASVTARLKKGAQAVWQHRYWEHQIRDEADFARHVDYIHYNPVKHGYVTCPVEWPYSSIHRYIRQFVLAPNWGCEPVDFPEGIGHE